MTMPDRLQTGPEGPPLARSIGRMLAKEGDAEPEALRAIRQAARDWLIGHGIPKGKEESWRQIPLDTLLGREPSPAQEADTEPVESLGLTPRGTCLALVDGEPVMPSEGLAPGLTLETVQQSLRREPDRLLSILHRSTNTEDGLLAAHTAGFRDGWVLRVARDAQIEAPVELWVTEWAAPGSRLSLPFVVCLLEPNSRLTLVERHVGRDPSAEHVSMGRMLIDLQGGAALEHARLVARDAQADLWWTSVDVGAHAAYRLWSASVKGSFIRWHLDVNLQGDDATCLVKGLYLARGHQRVAQHTRITHRGRRGKTQQIFRGVAGDSARAVFDGQVVVAAAASGTEAHQESRNLLLSADAVVHAKPQLEIDTDDVVCSHGATVGSLDPTQLFYLQSRGLPKDEAASILTQAFVTEIVEECPSPELMEESRQHIGRFAPGGAETGS